MSRPRRRWHQRLLIAFNAVLVVVCFASAAAIAYVYREVGEVPRVSIGGILNNTAEPGEAQNFLLVGVDDGMGLPDGDPVLAGRGKSMNTDTMMVLRVDPQAEKAALLSLPRDLWVSIPGGGKGRLNSAMALGGPEKLIETIQQNFDIPIHHYVQVDFEGFRGLVSAVGGVPIYFPWKARDTHTGLIQENPGCVTLDPVQALAFVRSRYFEIDEGDGWISDPTSDYGRISRQQHFIRASLKRAIAKGVRNPFTLNQLIGVAQKDLTLDDQITNKDLVDLGMQFRNFDPDSLILFTPPTTGGWAGAASVLYLNEKEAQPIFDVFRGVDSTYEPSRSVLVEVRNGSGRNGEGRMALNDLEALGFEPVRSTDATGFSGKRTTVRYSPGFEAHAIAIARYLDGDPEIIEDDSLADDVTVSLVTASDFTGIRSDPRPTSDFQWLIDEVAASTATTTVGGDDESATTTSSIRGEVPEAPEGISCG